MFTRQKKNYRIFLYSMLVITLCLLIVALLWPKEAEPEENIVSAESEVEEKQPSMQYEEPQQTEKNPENTEEEQQNEDMGQDGESYYMVRKDGDSICVFFCDGSGSEVKLEETEILYDLLPAEDQNAFDQGIKAEGQEELAALLQDFES